MASESRITRVQMVVGRCDTNKDGKVDLVELAKLMAIDSDHLA